MSMQIGGDIFLEGPFLADVEAIVDDDDDDDDDDDNKDSFRASFRISGIEIS